MEVPNLVLREGGFEIWEMPDGRFHLVIPSMGTVVCETERRARDLMVQTQGHVVVCGKINGKESEEHEETLVGREQRTQKIKGGF